MRSSITFLATVLVALVAVSNVSADTPLACYDASCTPLINILKDCQITVDSSTGNINFPTVANTTSDTDKCLCTQTIVNAYDPCYTCGAENDKIQDRFSTANLVDSCNANFGANTVKMPGSSGASSVKAGSFALVAASIVVSMITLV
ncbi:hypothetical protein BGZ80_001647 [Entomortierella chlamydospora]|uniref:Uncharacterized protein n=1 Tax=Entomortierella chlamydospora TaxID=101097 RepID=A0A9P6N2Y4_9FUNG|nr:hypothetical protein BGZ79_003266 [Entomortierella chlamydospora]KAG0021819.1 hypothetical protein BGZ80_001647 [Entomortierella chlamydospora]